MSAAKADGRDLDAKELAQLDQIDASVKALSAEFDVAQRAVGAAEYFSSPAVVASLPEAMQKAMGSVSSGPGPVWQTDSRGGRYAILNKEDRATSLLPAKSRNAFGHFVIAKLFGVNSATPPEVKMALSGDQNHVGGYLVPEELFGEIIDLSRARAALMQAGTRLLMMGSDSLLIPTLESDPEIKLRGENQPIHQEEHTFGQIRMQARNAGVMTKISRELVEDAPELLAEQLGMFLVAAMATTIDKWGIDGQGSSEPEGLYMKDIGEDDNVGAIDWLDVAKAATAIRGNNHEPNAVIMSPKRYADLFNAEVGDGVNASRGWLDAPPTLRQMQFLQTTNNADDKMLMGDFSRYAVGLRSSPLVEATSVGGEAFSSHQVHVKITARFDFAPLDRKAFRKMTGITD
jgi:HK97 family phage major capsid protein